MVRAITFFAQVFISPEDYIPNTSPQWGLKKLMPGVISTGIFSREFGRNSYSLRCRLGSIPMHYLWHCISTTFTNRIACVENIHAGYVYILV